MAETHPICHKQTFPTGICLCAQFPLFLKGVAQSYLRRISHALVPTGVVRAGSAAKCVIYSTVQVIC